MDDALDSYIVAACLHLLKIPDLQTESQRKQPVFDVLPDDERYKYIHSIAEEILDKYIMISDGMLIFNYTISN